MQDYQHIVTKAFVQIQSLILIQNVATLLIIKDYHVPTYQPWTNKKIKLMNKINRIQILQCNFFLNLIILREMNKLIKQT